MYTYDKLIFPRLAQVHFRIIKLPVYIYHPSHVNEPMKILNIICFSYFLRNYKILKMEACSSMLHWFTAVSRA